MLIRSDGVVEVDGIVVFLVLVKVFLALFVHQLFHLVHNITGGRTEIYRSWSLRDFPHFPNTYTVSTGNRVGYRYMIHLEVPFCDVEYSHDYRSGTSGCYQDDQM